MSYVRFAGDSDVYVFGSVSGYLECCGCKLFKYSYSTLKYSLMISHLQEHREQGHMVPARVFARLEKEKTENKDKFQVDGAKPKPIKNVRKTDNELKEEKFYREMDYHRKEMAKTALEIFKDIYGRDPHNLEIEGVAKAADITLDLHFRKLQ